MKKLTMYSYDLCWQRLLPYLQSPPKNTLWFADENAKPILSNINNHPNLYIVTNRFDIYKELKNKQFNCIFNDFSLKEYEWKLGFDFIIYRVSKEKKLTHHILKQAQHLLNKEGQLIICGEKNEGIKTYAKKIKIELNASGELKKEGNSYLGRFQFLGDHIDVLDSDYSDIQLITANITHRIEHFYSKPGIFGWNKIDTGTELLLKTAESIQLKKNEPLDILDLGCGYGWIFLNLSFLTVNRLVATDNNSAALICAAKNCGLVPYSVDIIPSDAGEELSQAFDLILCNPPFHQGFTTDYSLTERFIKNTKKLLKGGGSSLFVVNEFIPLNKIAVSHGLNITLCEHQQGFKVYLLEKS